MARALTASRTRLCPSASRLGLAAAGLLVLMALALAPAASAQNCSTEAGCGFDQCRIGVDATPAALWGDLEPTELSSIPAGKNLSQGRDASGFDEFKEAYSGRNWYTAVSSSGGYVFQGLAHGMSIWQPTPSGVPSFVSRLAWNQIPVQAVGENGKWPIVDIAVPAGRTDLVMLAGGGGMGVLVVDTSDIANPRVAYQDAGFDGQYVHATVVNGVAYGIAATSQGMRIYNLDAAPQCPSTTVCSGVKLNTTLPFSIAAVGGTGRYLAVGQLGVSIYDLSTLPGTPVKKADLAPGEFAQDVAMWASGNKTYVGVRSGSKLDIYDASCASGTCGTVPRLSRVSNLFDYGSQFLTLSQDGGRTYLYGGTDNRCGWDRARDPVQQMEYLFDVTNPAAPFDMTPPAKTIAGVNTGYWGWYYRMSPSGFNYIAPRSGVVIDGQLHRAALGLYDVHALTGGVPPVADFSVPSPIYFGTAAVFSDTSSGTYDNRSWSFQNGSPANSAAANPAVTFASAGEKQVILTVSGALGQDSETKTVEVLNPAPNITSIGVSPAAPKQCQPVTLTANATGKPPLSYAWTVLDGQQAQVAAGSGLSFVLNTKQLGLPAGSYTANLTVNGSGSDTHSTPVTLAALPPLSTTFAPTNDAFGAATVQFHVNVPGATEWSWDFGTGLFGPWIDDPVAGPNPVHTFPTIGIKQVRVQVRNCVETTPVISSVLAVDIKKIAPLVAGFQAQGLHCINAGAGPICSAEVGQAITFADQSSGDPLTWSYDWNNSTTSCGPGNVYEEANKTSPVTSHTFGTAGSFHPCLRVTRGIETEYHLHSTITVGNPTPPSISVSGPSSGTPGQALTFTASAANCSPAPSGWSWSTNGGTIAGGSSGSSISVSWASNGTKTVQASNSSCGSASGSRSVSISSGTPPPPPPPPGNVTAAFTAATSGQVGQSIRFDASASTGDIGGYSWDFGDGESGIGKTVDHTYDEAGSYTVRLTVGKTGCLSPGCFNSISKAIVIGDGGGGGDEEPPPTGSVAAAFEVVPGSPAAGQVATFDASTSTGNIGVYSWSFGDGGTGSGEVVTHAFGQPGAYTVTLSVAEQGCLSPGCFKTATKTVTVHGGAAVGVNGCSGDLADDVDKLCLGAGRYIVEVDWENNANVGEGQFRRLAGSESTGFFWFFNPDSIDMIVKIIDGSTVNEYVWVFFGTLTHAGYDLKVTDTLTQQTRVYPQESAFCGRADTTAFNTAGLAASTVAAHSVRDDVKRIAAESTEELLLLDGRFRATVSWENHHVPTGMPHTFGAGRSIPGTDGSGYFYFFEPSSLDLVIKMIDAREFDGHFWVFWGGLSDVRYDLEIEDLETGETWNTVSQPGNVDLCGGNDLKAFGGG
jgi:PKD repeat protein